jgi:riboflavin biosynthesis pyrimidine reductase
MHVRTSNSIRNYEGGRQTLQTFIDANLWDEARVFQETRFFYKEGMQHQYCPKLL